MPELDPMESLQVVYAQALVRERARARLTQDQLGQHPAVMVSGKLIGHVENCRRPPTARLSQGIDTALDLNAYFQSLFTHWKKEEGPPSAIYEYADLEINAASLKMYSCQWVTGLLQTPEYAREVFSAGESSDRIDVLVTGRMERQKILDREDPPWVVVHLDEFVIRRIVGSRDIARGQLAHLLELMQRPNVSISVVPDGARVYPVGSFVLLESPEMPNLAYLEAAAGHSLLLQSFAQVRELRIQYDQIAAEALTVADSEKFIREVMEGL
ncbi:Scr1 family TA system antitoxin-like transcriptional regulator [Actinomadura adrarensis]|uniref:Scr1 family TA system antitoxin-like transcriptional regulator n=1 Tax=Actinomadura adrarensis TaxID=1819600 RepID=A0ABW3CRU8_9ACTN